MLIDAVRGLRSAEVDVDVAVVRVHADGAGVDTILEVTAGDVRCTFAAEEKARAPYPNELTRLDALRKRIARTGEPMLVAPFVNEALASALRTREEIT